MIDIWSAAMQRELKDMPHCFRRTNIATILIMMNLICSTIWRDDDGCTIWTFGDVLVDVLDASKEVGTKLNIHMASKKHGEMRIIRNTVVIVEYLVPLLTLSFLSLVFLGNP